MRRSRPSGDAADPSHGDDDNNDEFLALQLILTLLNGMDLTVWLYDAEVAPSSGLQGYIFYHDF